METENAKQAQRAAGKAARRALSPAQRAAADRAICAAVAGCEAFRAARVVLLYCAFGGEADLAGLTALAAGKTLAWPYCPEPGRMEVYAPAGPEDWTVDRYGIRAPDPARARPVAPEEIGLVLVPGTAFDRQGGRVGMGAGVYDRYLPRCPQAVRLGVAYEAQLVERAAAGPLDVRMDGVVTEAGVRYAEGELK